MPRTVTETMERAGRASRGFSLEKRFWRTSSPMLENRGPVPSRMYTMLNLQITVIDFAIQELVRSLGN